MKHPSSKPFEPILIEMLHEDEEFAVEYLRAAFEDDSDPRVLLNALRQVAEARGGLARLAKRAGLPRESLYRILSAKGNPTLNTLNAVTRALGLKITVEAA